MFGISRTSCSACELLCVHNQEKSNEIACGSFKEDANANSTAWEGVKAILVNSDAADNSLS